MNRLSVVLIWLLPLFIFMILGQNGIGISPFFVGLILLLLFFAVAGLMWDGGRSEKEEQEEKREEFSDEKIRFLARELQPFLAVKGWKAAGDVVLFEGSLLSSPPTALAEINDKLAPSNLRAILTEGEQNPAKEPTMPAVANQAATRQSTSPCRCFHQTPAALVPPTIASDMPTAEATGTPAAYH